MSYDLTFWKQSPEFSGSPQDTYEKLSEELPVSGLEALPIDEFKGRIMATFSGCAASERAINWEGKEGAFQVTWSERHVRVDCYNLTEGAMNRLVDIALEFDCPLYDPQVGRRFD